MEGLCGSGLVCQLLRKGGKTDGPTCLTPHQLHRSRTTGVYMHAEATRGVGWMPGKACWNSARSGRYGAPGATRTQQISIFTINAPVPQCGRSGIRD